MSISNSLPCWSTNQSFPSICGQGRDLIEKVLSVMDKMGWSQHDMFAVNMALEESFTNAIEHGNHCNKRKKFHVSCQVTPQSVLISVRDEGKGYTRERLPDPLDEENIETPSGRGILLIHGFMSRVWYNDAGNEIHMEKLRTQPASL